MEAKTAKSTKKEDAKKDERPYIFAVGKRTTAVARVKLFPNGKGEIVVNERKVNEYLTVGNDVAIFLATFKSAEADEK